MSASVWTVTEPEIMEMPRYLDSDTAADVEQDARLCIRSGGRELILDCYAVEKMTAAGLRAILALAADMKKAGGKFAVCNLQGQALELFEACSFGQIIPSYTNQDEAVARLAA